MSQGNGVRKVSGQTERVHREGNGYDAADDVLRARAAAELPEHSGKRRKVAANATVADSDNKDVSASASGSSVSANAAGHNLADDADAQAATRRSANGPLDLAGQHCNVLSSASSCAAPDAVSHW